MMYINSLNLINLCVKHNILKEKDGNIFVYRSKTETSKEGWYLEPKDMLAQELKDDKKGQETLISALKEKNIKFQPNTYIYKEESK